MTAIERVRNLQPGESYSTAVFVTGFVTPSKIKDIKGRMGRTMSKLVWRVGGQFTTYTIHAFTEHYELIVVGVIVRAEEDEI